LILSTSTRNHATIASIQKGHHLRVLREALRSNKELPMKKRDALGKFSSVKRRNDRARAANKHLLDVPKEGGDESFLSKYTQGQGLQTELKWTGGDALKLAQSVLDKLKAGDVQKALEMVRLSEKLSDVQGKKGVDSVVSWNHVMDYYMSKSLTREAFKVFNEVRRTGLLHSPLDAQRHADRYTDEKERT
jgi:pentatricopeptide repeat protein